jgi:hypothetical protein
MYDRAMRLSLLLIATAAGCDESTSRPPAPTEVPPLEIGDVFGFDEIVESPADGGQSQPAAAWTGGHFLVAWVDDYSGMRAVRFDLEGVPIDDPPLTLAPRGNLRMTRVACRNEACAVAWMDLSVDPGVTRLIRIAADGTLTDATPLTFPGYWPLLGAYDGGFVVGWQTTQGLVAARLGTSGPALDATPIEVARASQISGSALSCDDAGCVAAVTTCEPGGSCTARSYRVAASDASVTPAGGTPLPMLLSPLAAATGPDGFIVADASYDGVRAILVDASGTPTSDAAATVFAPATGGTGMFEQVALAADEGGFVVVARQSAGLGRRLVAKRVAFDGTVAPGLPVDLVDSFDQEGSPALACAPARCLVASSLAALGSFDLNVVMARFEGMTTLDDPPLQVAKSANRQYAPGVASDGTDYLVVWTDGRGGGSFIRAARLSEAGTWRDTNSLEIGRVGGPQPWPTVAWTGERYLVVWSDLDGVYSRTVSPEGEPLEGPNQIRSGNFAAGTPHEAGCNAGMCLLPLEIEGRETAIVLDSAGQPTGTEFDLGSTNADRAQIAYNAAADLFGVVWVDHQDPTGDRIMLARVRPDGLSGEPVDVTGDVIIISGGLPSITTVGEDFIVAWGGEWDDVNVEWDVGFRVLGSSASPRTEPIALATTQRVEFSAMAATLGDHALIGWHEYDGTTQETRLAGQRVNVDGIKLDPTTIDFGPAAKVTEPVLVAGALGRALLVWEEYRPELPFAAIRLRILPLRESTSP